MRFDPEEEKDLQDKDEDRAPDLSQEGANMRELLARQPKTYTLLSFCSKAAQAVLEQF